MLDLLQRLQTTREQLGEEAFIRACHAAQVAIARTAMEQAERSEERLAASEAAAQELRSEIGAEQAGQHENGF
jgi:hypothetical protein